MLTENLFEKVLIEPVREGADEIYIVSGYASAAMAFHHLNTIRRNLKKSIKANLIIGMCPSDGLSISNHRAFQQLVSEEFPEQFVCSYLINEPSVHSKVYVWKKRNELFSGFLGSANYTQNAFSKGQRELLDSCDPEQALSYFEKLIGDSIYCTHSEVENYVELYNDTCYPRIKRERFKEQGLELITSIRPDLADLPAVRVSLLDNKGNLASRSGLNWGQRPELKREPNQAYIRLTASIYKTNFFPPRGVHFTVLTDDNKVLICTRAQENGKAIETPHNNSLIGEYFRHRLGLPSGKPVTKGDLIRYGRTDIEFYKIDDETYFMNFA